MASQHRDFSFLSAAIVRLRTGGDVPKTLKKQKEKSGLHYPHGDHFPSGTLVARNGN